MAEISVLIVEDEGGLRELYESELARAGFLVFAVGNGEEGLGVALERRPSIIILDIMLPGMSGLDVLAKLKQRPETKDIPVIIMSALEDTDDRARGLSLGATSYIGKTEIDPQRLIEQIRQVVKESA